MPGSRRRTVGDGPIQLRPPVLLPMGVEQEATAVAMLAALIGARLARCGADLISPPVNALLDARPADDADTANPAA